METRTRHLLVDGYNVIHCLPDLKRHFREGVSAGCARLVAWVGVLHDVEGIRVTVVFDGRGDDIEIERPTEDLTYSVLYSPRGMSADDLIEQLVGASEKPDDFQVVTRDNLVRETVRALGAEPLSPEELRDWVARCEKRLAGDLRSRQRAVERDWRRGK